MSEDATQFTKRDRIFSTSTRGCLAILVILTICSLAFLRITVDEPLYTLSVAITAFYYGQNQKTPS